MRRHEINSSSRSLVIFRAPLPFPLFLETPTAAAVIQRPMIESSSGALTYNDTLFVMGGFGGWPENNPSHDGMRCRNDVYKTKDGGKQEAGFPCEVRVWRSSVCPSFLGLGVEQTTCRQKQNACQRERVSCVTRCRNIPVHCTYMFARTHCRGLRVCSAAHSLLLVHPCPRCALVQRRRAVHGLTRSGA